MVSLFFARKNIIFAPHCLQSYHCERRQAVQISPCPLFIKRGYLLTSCHSERSREITKSRNFIYVLKSDFGFISSFLNCPHTMNNWEIQHITDTSIYEDGRFAIFSIFRKYRVISSYRGQLVEIIMLNSYIWKILSLYMKINSSSSWTAYPYLWTFFLHPSHTSNIRILSVFANLFANFFSISSNTMAKILLLFFSSKTEYWSLLPYFSKNFEKWYLTLLLLISYETISIFIFLIK